MFNIRLMSLRNVTLGYIKYGEMPTRTTKGVYSREVCNSKISPLSVQKVSVSEGVSSVCSRHGVLAD